ncbi:GLIPR1-like protein 1 [Onychomys torridus]|uniref:GLIPR1-like protein 1 n=1 Tax=Onychomys torridus TaxID=38674 RepID=UPI00167F3F1F|nr:GLIPR1-like protein 1 [Onychomys torridus]
MKKLNCFWTLGLCLVASKLSKALVINPRVPSIYDSKFIQEIVDSHNELRSKVNPSAANMNYLYWDKKLAKVAESWSNKCQFAHNPCINKQYQCDKDYDVLGENIFLGGIQTTPKRMISYWYNESQHYTFDTMACSKVCGHYTQVVWANSLRIGCALSSCPNLGSSMGLFVCNYSPPGNYRDTKPYIKGESCSNCTTSDCKDNLCHDWVVSIRI